MKVSALVLVLLASLESASSFAILPSKAAVTRSPFVVVLKYAIVYPDDDEEPQDEIDPNSVAATTVVEAKQEVTEDAGPASLDTYQDYDEMQEVEGLLNVDAHDNEAGGIVPGFHLSSLCSDD